MLIAPGAAFAQDADAPTADARAQDEEEDTIVVTAQRRTENLQDVPIAITAIGTKQLDDLQVNSFDDYAALVPSLSYKSLGPGGSNVYFRGVASGENANHSASLPSVGTYLDEQPITTIQGALDLHIFDIERVEALAGPQGTLYGASSQAGTVRIITNKPDLSGLYGEVNLEVNQVSHGGIGYTGEGFINAPISDRIALRVVGWYRHDAGYIDNIEGALDFPTWGQSFSNAALAEDDYNDIDTYGARAALKIELDDDWTVTPQLMGQVQKANGSFAQESGLDELETMQFNPESTDDRWLQAALTVQGKVGNLDLTYAGSYLKRQIDGEFDYIDYAYFYDALFGYGAYFYDNAGDYINPNQYVQSDDTFNKMSHELRFTTPGDKRVRLVGGAFYQRQEHNIEQNYIVDNLTDLFVVPTTESNIWLTKQLRTDRDFGLFGEVSYDVTDALTVTGGGRYYKFDNSLEGFFGFSDNYSSRTGVAACFEGPQLDGTPCTNVDKRTKGDGFLHRLNATYSLGDNAMVYGTWSRGYRPGGINRRGTLPPYDADFIENFEIGTKLGLPDRRGHFNVAIYQLNWTDIQLSFLGQNGLTEIRNAGDARIRGIEADLLYRPAPGFSLGLGMAYNDAKLRNDFCKIANPEFDCGLDIDLNGSGDIDNSSEENELLAPSGTRLPLTARFKANANARYAWDALGGRAHVQATLSYEGDRTRDLRTFESGLYGEMDGYAQVGLSAGLDRENWTLDVFVKNLFDERGVVSTSFQCTESTCGDPDGVTAIGGKLYSTVIRPRTIGIKIGKRF
ncbi:TonB-dependent receptor [Sphingomicrobium flavum]|uniref:TonB-dependent receptor n=1 Tax=Sphingomicrobium flavum TaxID=1229164 RepID=UPI0021AD78AF|nr:TonB-dependent receptor [Sphingomicrobium flavum]